MFKSEFANLIVNLVSCVIVVTVLIRISNGNVWMIVLSILLVALRAVYDIVKYKRTKSKES
ncbi:hypothetical protein M3685_21980 [Heyndrickxia oleronia]|nr:hypothetical protein [Heyndrickxia oleronia]